jgi:hypothetical protein
MVDFPFSFQLEDGTTVMVKDLGQGRYEFHLTRLNSERHNFNWIEETGEIDESYETRFDNWQLEATRKFRELTRGTD